MNTTPHTPDQIENIEARFLLVTEPSPHVEATVTINYNTGEEPEIRQATLTGYPAASIAMSVLEASSDIREANEAAKPNDGPGPAGRPVWAQGGVQGG